MKHFNLTISNLFSWAFFSLVFLFFIVKAIKTADYSWDVLAYHLPFSAMATGILDADSYSMSVHLSHAYLGFPDIIYHLKGWLWEFTGSPAAANLVNIIALFTYCIFCHQVLRIRMIWSLCGVLAIPIIHVAIPGGMTDVFANIFLAIGLLSLFKIQTERAYYSRSLLLWFYAALFLAAGSKPQAIPLAAILLAVLFSLKLYFDIFVEKKCSITFYVVFFVCAAIVLHKLLLNLVFYQNPLYPMQLNVLGFQFPGVFKTSTWSDPQYLAETHQSIRWLLSLFEFDAFSMRPVPYTVDQGDVPVTSRGFRMGGYNGILVMLSLFFLGAFLKLSSYKNSVSLMIFISLSALLVSALPGSHELRYYSFWMIFLVTSVLFLSTELSNNSETLKLLGIFYKGILITCIIYFASITGGRYQTVPNISYENFDIKSLQNTNIEDHGICIFGDDSRFAILVAINDAITSNARQKIIQRQSVDECKLPNQLEAQDHSK